jgi:DNA-binding CsgD family transcriptional regulator
MPKPADPAVLADPAFPHNTERGYFRGCKGDCCLRAHNRAGLIRDLRQREEGHVFDMLAKAQAHLLSLMEPGVTINDLTRASGLSWKVLHPVLAGHALETRRPQLRKMLALTAEEIQAKTYWGDRKRARQQIGSLQRLGWTLEWMTKQVGVNCRDIDLYEKMTRTTADRIDRLYREIGDRRGPSTITAMRAKRAGWRVPGAYDDKGNLIPGAALDDESPAFRAKMDVAERRAEVHRLLAEGLGPTEIAERLGVSRDVVFVDTKRSVRYPSLERHSA